MTQGGATLREISAGTYAYLQVGSWGYSNAGLITSQGVSLLVDTLYDLALTAEMLSTMRRVCPAAETLDSVVNTHANGDHCWGNQLVGSADIISSRAAAEEMLELSPRVMHGLVAASRAIVALGPWASVPLRLLGRLGVPRAAALVDAAPFVLERFGGFDFGSISLRTPSTTFEHRLVLQVGDKEVHLIAVGPAHTKGDVIVYVPADRVVYTGDILFVGSHPIVWDGPIENWCAACDVVLGLDVDVIVPGHGPLTDKRGVQQTKAYWQRVQEVAQLLPAEQAARLLCREFDWDDAERCIVNVLSAQRQRGVRVPGDALSLLALMARARAT